MRLKKGQVAIFIIISIIILIIFGVTLYISSTRQKLPEQKIAPPSTPEGQLQAYVGACLDQLSLEGLEIMRQQGGYINTKSSQSLKIQGRDVPYWLNRTELRVPPLSFMEKELADYVSLKIEVCLKDFKSFKDQGFTVTKKADYSVSVQMANQVVVNLNYPVQLSRENYSQEMNEFIFRVPINMRLIQGLSSDLVSAESIYAFLEDNTNNMISVYSSVDKNFLPPRSANIVNFDCKSVTWRESDVKELLKRIIAESTPYVNVDGTNFTKITRLNNPLQEGIFNAMTYRIFPANFPRLKINFSYDTDWYFNAAVHPSKGGMIKPEIVKQTKIPFVPMFCTFDYQYDYDAEYPVLVTLTDPDSAKIEKDTFFEGKGFSFQFPMVVFINSNVPRQEVDRIDYGANASSMMDSFGLENLIIDPALCDDLSDQETTIKTVDAITKDKLSDVRATLKCADTECDLGSAQDGVLTTNLPICPYDKKLILDKDEYNTVTYPFISLTQGQEFELQPLKEFTISVKKVNLPDYMASASSEFFSPESIATDLTPNVEKAIINIVGDKDVQAVYPVPGIDTKIKLGIGSYTLTITLQGPVDIADTPYYDESGDPLGTIPGFKEPNWNVGSIEIPFEVSTQDTYRNTILFYVFEEKAPGNLRDWNDITNAIIQSDQSLKYHIAGKEVVISQSDYSQYLKPLFS